MANVLVFIDNPGDALKKSTLELLTLGRSLGETAVAVNGDLHQDVSATLAEYGVTAVFRPSAQDLDDYLVSAKAAYLAAAAGAASAGTVLLDNSPEGKEIAARLGIRLNAGVITDVVAVDADGTAHKSVLAGSYTTSARVTTAVSVLTVKANNVTPEPASVASAPETSTVEVPANGTATAARVTAREQKAASGRPDLSDARIVVAGGRGVDGDFGPVEQLADALGAAVGPPVQPRTPAGSATTPRWARPARPCRPSSTSRPASPVPSSRKPGCRQRRSSWP
ncbi:electron transfer flavoprotein subunit alpha [Arthrobacter sp. Hiyo4]|nr:electron transfer flavoprotein subunit alpha [Arthrobacter sp. Hiyo4]